MVAAFRPITCPVAARASCSGCRLSLITDHWPLQGRTMPTLLVVDDEPSILYFFRQAFAEPEVTLLTASSAAEALEMVTRVRPDVVVLDINLPDASGLDTFRQ